MASGPITSWQIDGEKMETVTDFIFLGSKITVGGDRSHEIKRHLLLCSATREATTMRGLYTTTREKPTEQQTPPTPQKYIYINFFLS